LDEVEGASVTLIEGGYGNRAGSAKRAKRRRTARAAAPLLIPLALALTLGVILAVSPGAPTARVTQQSASTSSAHP
jgi:Na+/glutamate symporter